MKNKLSLCSPHLGLSYKAVYGGEVYDYKTIDGLCNKDIKCLVLLPKNRLYKKHKNLQVEYLPFKPIVPPHLFNLFIIPYLFRKFKQEPFDILRVHSPYYVGLGAWLFKKIYPNIKVVMTYLLDEDRLDFKFLLKKTVNIYDHIFVPSEYLKKVLINKYKYPSKKISLVYGGVDDYLKPGKKNSKVLKKLGLKNKIVMLNVGSLIERKNVLFLLDLYQKLFPKYPNLALVYLGTGELKTEMIQRISKRNLQNVFVLDPVFDLEKRDIYNISDIFLFPTKNDGLGLVAIEAMACGKPVVASNNSALPEVVTDGVTGFLATTSNVTDWAKKVEKLIENKKLRKKMGLAGLKKVRKKFNWSYLINQNIKIYQQLIND